MRNLITDVRGLLVGHADDSAAATGVTVALFERPTVASVAILGGAPGVRETALLEPEMTVEHVDAIVLCTKLMKILRSDGPVALESHVTDPKKSPIFPEYKRLVDNHQIKSLI